MVMQRLLEFVGIEPERFHTRWVSGSEAAKFTDIVTQISEEIKKIGPNRKLRDSNEQ